MEASMFRMSMWVEFHEEFVVGGLLSLFAASLALGALL
jgi:hypothetical protein